MVLRDVFYAAVNAGNETLVKSILVEDGELVFSCDERGYTPLLIAVEQGHTGMLELLCSRGADLKDVDANGYSVLHLATSLEMAELLVKKGADIKAKSNTGLTPLHCTVLDNYGDIVQLLIEKGADIDARDTHGYTPLMMAREYKLPEIAAILKEKGARE